MPARQQIRKILGHSLRTYRLAHGFTQQELSEKCGLSLRLYQGVESGAANPTLLKLYSIASALRITIHDLLRLRFIRTDLSQDDFCEKFKNSFRSSKFGVVIRSLDGYLYWGNSAAARTFLIGTEEYGPVDTLELLSDSAQMIFKAQLACERRGLIQPYINLFPDLTGAVHPRRLYPTLIYPPRSSKAIYTVVYAIDPDQDSEENYFTYCEELLKLAEK